MHHDAFAPLDALKRRLVGPKLSLCMAVRLVVQPDIVLIAKTAGLDALYIDLEHGSVSPEAVRHVAVTALAASIPCLVRVPNPSDIPRLLDAGAAGVICPDIRTPEASRAAVAAAKFPPLGSRGVAAAFPQFGYQPLPARQALPALNTGSIVVAQIESAEGLANVEAIAAVEGVDMLLVGANDLLADLGLAGEFDHPDLRAACARILAACKRHGIAFGIGGLTSRPALVADLVQSGAVFVSIGNDVNVLAGGVRACVERFSQLME